MYPTKKLWEIWIFNRWITYNKWDLLESYQKWCVTLLRANNINDWLFLDDLQYLPWWFVKNDKILQKDDIIFCMSSWSKHLVWKNARVSNLDNFSFWAFCSMFRKNTDDDIDYISYYLKSDLYKNYIFNFSQWVNILNLKNSDLENCEIPLPPLPTQKLIVQKLDSAFENIDKNINLTKENLKNLEELNKSVLEQVFSEWEYEIKKLWEVVKIIWWWTPPKNKPEYYWWNILWATVRDMNVMVIKDTELKITEEWLRNSSANIIPSNWIIIATRVWLWKVSLISQDTAINQDLKWIIPNNELENKFLYRFFQSISNYILQNWIGATVKWVNLDFIKNLEIPLPPLQKQKEIVEYLDEVFAKNKELKTKYELQLKELEELKQSLLKDAFEGRLLKE